MKLAMRNWRWVAALLAVGLICATYLVAQTPTKTNLVAAMASPPDAQETADSERLIDAVNAGDTPTALDILRSYGVSDNTLLAMASRLGKPAPSLSLSDSFLKTALAAWSVGDWTTRTNLQANLQNFSTALGYQRPIWIPHRYDSTAIDSFNDDLLQMSVSPVVQLDVKPNNACFIRWFLWCDRYIDSVHSLAINGANLNNGRIPPEHYAQANRTLNALFQLIKARKPDAFVWLAVAKQDNLSDAVWLQAMTFKPDGLQIWNLSQFHSPFAQTRTRYASIVGTNTPMMVVDFYGYTDDLKKYGGPLFPHSKRGTGRMRSRRGVNSARSAG